MVRTGGVDQIHRRQKEKVLVELERTTCNRNGLIPVSCQRERASLLPWKSPHVPVMKFCQCASDPLWATAAALATALRLAKFAFTLVVLVRQPSHERQAQASYDTKMRTQKIQIQP